MAEFSMKIAGHTGRVTSLFDSTRDYCRNYLTEDAPEFSFTVTREDLAYEQAFLLEEARQEGMKPRTFTDPFLERATIQRAFAEHLLGCDILLFHGSGISLDGNGYLFTAPCGTGKSTHTRLWRQVFGDRAVMVNDDKPFLEITDSGVTMHGAPWSGKHGLDANLSVPLKGICILARGAENRIAPLPPEDAAPMLLHQSFPPRDPGQLPKLKQLAAILGEKTRLWQMQCTKDPIAAEIAFAAMSASEKQ